MDLFNPADRRPVHFMGVGGAGMSALAVLACRRGVVVTGCDTDLAGAQDVIASGAQVMLGHDPSHVTGTRAVVVTAAVPDTHPELEQARAAGIPVVPRKEALGGLVNGATVVGAAGTHGKTTTTVMTTAALEAAGLAPTGLAGGRVRAWGGNARLGGTSLYVVEADEYDKAFLALAPTVAIVNNVEPDHLECYGSLEQLEAAFAEFAGRADTVLIGADDAGARRVAGNLRNRVWRFGTAADAEIHIGAVRQDASGSRSAITLPDGRRVTLTLRVPGMHNVRNAAGALGAVAALDGAVERALEALAEFSGVGRRFDRLGEAGGVVLVDDYAHHPSELVATLAAARQAYPERRLVAVFQPHLYSRTQEHGAAMGQALAAADVVVVADVYGAREAPVPGITGQLVADAAAQAGADVTFEPDRSALGRQVRARLRPGDLVLTLGAGDITRLGPELLAALAPA
ncbi:MAG TPA: UDP-N-acetylmuramate--L-alanine ligase [Gemmatimonadales bacterium]|jgi:UDP-N-acetylmuramate--alanine ligase|nr:UDP-N-acetylmuramate--L-alanine ligase [Gemmatimonadales bacterium]